ncbi:methylcytosine dioxygenase TET isoform X2 [Phlebotomus papatasi]|uniref:methylcytosine dioxygenase TET isoform X2 n=1 Tax=Phlebotomus papatasi TaxID=29031 RepID=UPI0024833DBD|nr:methylcytosine dioxygenase TET isoform X2 [Phlebotomus papatasi]
MASMMSASTEDAADHSLPSFTNFSSDLDPTSWEYYERGDRSTDVIASQQASNYTRPWEMDSKDKGFEPFSKLPSFQSQFHSYSDPPLVPEPSLPQPVPVPVSPSSASPGNGSLTQLTPINPLQTGLTTLPSPSFHTLTAVNTRTYPLVPAPIQARDIPTIQQQYLDERHIQLYQPIATFPGQNVVTVLKNEPANFDLKNGLHHSNFQNPLLDNGFDGSKAGSVAKDTASPTRCDVRKKERRKIRASSLESSAESESSAMELGDVNSGQVAAVSSTASFKSPMGSMGMADGGEDTGEKQTKKKRKRCGECIGCQRKDNCGDCAPCRNDKSHQICKQRRCEKLTDKKLIYGADGTLIRGESRRGRGKGRGGGVNRSSVRGRKALKFGTVISPRPQPPTSSISPAPAAVPQPSPNTTTASTTNQLVVVSGGSGGGVVNPPVVAQAQHNQQNQQSQQQAVSAGGTTVQTMKDQPQQPMAPMAFYPTWQADPSQGWQNQFIQQIPQNSPAITPLNTIEFQPQSYTYQPNGYVQTGIGFDPSYGRTYATPVQRYEFQANQIAPINQVSLQSVSFAPSVTYAGQVSTGPSPVLLASPHPTQNTVDATKASGNELPGYPRVNSVPPRSLNCNGYSGDFGGNSSQNSQSAGQMQHFGQQSSTAMHPPQVPQSPNRNTVQMQMPHNSPSAQVPQSPNHHLGYSQHPGMSPMQQSPNQSNGNSHSLSNISPNHMNQSQQQSEWGGWSSPANPPGNDMFNQSDRVNLNTRLKTMILSKGDAKDGSQAGMQPPGAGASGANGGQQTSSQTGHFLSYSHHLREGVSLTDGNRCPTTEPVGGGGETCWKTPKTENFQRQDAVLAAPYGPSSIEKSLGDPGGGGGGTEDPLKVTPKVAVARKKEEKPRKDFNYPNYSDLSYPQIRGENTFYSPSMFDGTHGAFHQPGSSLRAPAAKERQSIKQEPTDTYQNPQHQVKLEGYERNYQNFIKYADYCDVQQKQPPQEYPGYSQPYYTPDPLFPASSYPNYPTYTPQNPPEFPPMTFPGPTTETEKPELPAQTNFEKEIPAHTYHIPTRTHIDSHPHCSPENMDTQKLAGYPFLGEGGPAAIKDPSGFSCCRKGSTAVPTSEHLKDGSCIGLQTKDEILLEGEEKEEEAPAVVKEEAPSTPVDRTEKNTKPEVPDCDCFPSDKTPPEPGSYYTHLGAAATLSDLRSDMEARIGVSGRQLRIEKIIYTGKEGKTSQGCPLAKWIIRRADPEEKILCVVKRRQGHRCQASFIVVCIVAWDGIPTHEADSVYKMLIHKLNKFGLPTTRRCATNENRTCACQGLDPESCGASYSFGCSWSMYYNGCKYARSKTVRKFRLSVKTEEAEIEERMNILATMLGPLYVTATPKAFENQCKYEREAPDCRLGLKPGKPFSGVTACMDFCAHAHRDLHNMQDGCTVQVALLKQRPPGVPPSTADDEQLHVLPLYVMDTTDEFGSADGQKDKHKSGAVQVLEKFPCEVRIRSTPLQPCRRHGKKRNGKDVGAEELPDPPPPPITGGGGGSTPSKKDNAKMAKGKGAVEKGGNGKPPPPSSCQSPRSSTPGTPGGSTAATGTSAFSAPVNTMMNSNSSLLNMASMIDNFTDAQLQSNQISSTVLDSPYSYDYNTGSYIDSRNYYGQWPDYGAYNDRTEQVKSRGSEENPDSTTLPSSGSSAFSPSVPVETKVPTCAMEDYKDTGFVKPKAPEYPPTYGYPHHPNTYSMYPPYSPYDHYQNMDYYGNEKLRYNFGYPQTPYHHPYNMYPNAAPAPPPPAPPSAPNWCMYPPQASTALAPPPMMMPPKAEIVPKPEPIGEVAEINDNLECFQDSQMGGVAIALGHGSVLFECAKHEMHATTALRRPNRLNPTRITLIFYQHRNLNRPKHGTEEWEEKMRVKKQNAAEEARAAAAAESGGASVKQEPRDQTKGPSADKASKTPEIA